MCTLGRNLIEKITLFIRSFQKKCQGESTSAFFIFCIFYLRRVADQAPSTTELLLNKPATSPLASKSWLPAAPS